MSKSLSPWDEPASEEVTSETVASVPENDEPLSLQQEVELWGSRAHSLWLESKSAGDLRSMAASLQAAFKSLTTRATIEEASRQEVENKHSPGVGMTIEQLDDLVRAAVNAGDARCCSCGRPYPLPGEPVEEGEQIANPN